MEVTRALSLESCCTSLVSRKSDEVLEELAGLILKSPVAGDIPRETIVEGLRQREELGSTGFGNGVAIPHCKITGMKEFVMALGISRGGIPFNAMDKHSVHIFCAIVGPEEDTEGHLRLLAAAARVLAIGKARYELLRSETPYALREEFLYHTAPASAVNGVETGTVQKLLTIVVQEENWYNEIMELFLELGVLGAVRAVSMIGWGSLSDRIGRKKVAIIAAVIQAGAMLWMVWAQELWMLYLFAAVYGLGNGGLFAGITPLLGDTFGLHKLGTVLGMLEIGWGIGAAIGPLLGGFLFDNYESYTWAFVIGAAAMLMICFLVVMIKPVRKKLKNY